MTLYKILKADGSCCHGGVGTWLLPNGATPGEWMPEITGELIPCHRGYHLFRIEYLLDWIGPALFVAEHKGEIIQATNKMLVREARLVRRVEGWTMPNLIRWASDCFEHVLPIYERQSPGDDCLHKAIEAARNGSSAKKKKAWEVSDLAAAGAEWSAALAVEREAAELMVRAVGDATVTKWMEAAAELAAAAAGVAAEAGAAGERRWQLDRLCELTGIK